MFDVSHNPYDFTRDRRLFMDCQPFADRVFVRPEAAGQALIDDGHSRISRSVTFDEITAGAQRDAERAKVGRADDAIVNLREIWRKWGRAIICSDAGSRVAPAQWQLERRAGGNDARQALYAPQRLLKESGLLIPLPVLGAWQRDVHGQRMIRFEARIDSQ